ncbi:hypothetical protein HpDR66_13420 [Helicobacter pylori]
MKQRVKAVSYLVKAEFEIKNGTYDLVALPSGAEVVKCDLEVVGETPAAKASVGFKDEKEVDFFLHNITLDTHKYNNSAKCCTVLGTKVISAKIIDAATTNAKVARGVLRVIYFLPSETEVEY